MNLVDLTHIQTNCNKANHETFEVNTALIFVKKEGVPTQGYLGKGSSGRIPQRQCMNVNICHVQNSMSRMLIRRQVSDNHHKDVSQP